MISAQSPACGAAGIDWYAFLARPRLRFSDEAPLEQLRDRSILVTGAGGSIGSALSLRVAALRPRRLVLLDASEQALYRLQLALSESGLDVPVILANILDGAHVDEILEIHRPQLIFHAAAYKHVPLLEDHPLEAIANNALGTLTLIESAKRFSVARVVLLSTDKAVAPASILGASKRIAERIVLANDGVVLRLGNVLGTEGSVSETFLRQIAAGDPLTITDPEAERYFLTCEEAVDLLLASATMARAASVIVPRLDHQYSVMSLAEFLVSRCSTGTKSAIRIIGTRLGDKTREVLLTSEEQSCAVDRSEYFEVRPKLRDLLELEDQLERLKEAVRERNMPCVFEIVSQLVPDYTPSAKVQAAAQSQTCGTVQR